MAYPSSKLYFDYKKGDKIGLNTYIAEDRSHNDGRRHVFLKCNCGNLFSIQLNAIKSGHTKSCGCFRRNMVANNNFRHGLRKLPEYSLWLNMKQRCTNTKYKNFRIWGGRGITICNRWLSSFESFYNDMGKQPFKRAGIDRINNELGYSKENCRWASPKTQCNNTRRNVMISFNNEIKSAAMWAQELNLSYPKMMYHLRKKIKTVPEIFTISKIAA